MRPGDDLAALLVTTGVELRATDVVAIAHKIVSKSEGRVVALAEVTPDERATTLAAEYGKDPATSK